jgi:hypothetical protein
VGVEIGQIGGKEFVAWPCTRKFEDKPATELMGSRMVSSGEFTLFTRRVCASLGIPV